MEAKKILRLSRGDFIERVCRSMGGNALRRYLHDGSVEVCGVFESDGPKRSPYVLVRAIGARENRPKRKYLKVFASRNEVLVVPNATPDWRQWQAGGDRPDVYERANRMALARPVKVEPTCPLCRPPIKMQPIAEGYRCPKCKAQLSVKK